MHRNGCGAWLAAQWRFVRVCAGAEHNQSAKTSAYAALVSGVLGCSPVDLSIGLLWL